MITSLREEEGGVREGIIERREERREGREGKEEGRGKMGQGKKRRVGRRRTNDISYLPVFPRYSY